MLESRTDAPQAAAAPARAQRVARVWALNVAIATAAALVFAAVVAGREPISEPHIGWYWVAVAIAVCERWPVRLQFRRSAHAFSLTDIPVALAFIFASGPDAAAGVAIGAALSMAWDRLPAVKVVFNVCQFLLATCLGFVVLEAVAGAHPAFGPMVWVGALLATLLGGVVTIALLSTVIWLTEGRPSRADLREMFGMDGVVTLTNTSLALLAAVVLVAQPAAIPILLVPVLVTFLGYRAYVSTRERHERLEFLLETSRTITASPEVAIALEGLLDRARDAFRVEQAEVILFGSDEHPPLRTRLGPGDERHVREPVAPAAAAALRELVAGGPVAFGARAPAAVAPLLEGRRVRSALVTALRGEHGILGTILLANPAGLARGFEHDDLALLESLAASASAALQDERLEVAVAELRDLQHQLRHQAYHDALTGLPNRTQFSQQAAAALAEDADVAALFVDLDDFKTVNDTLGHAAGDQLLCAAALRIGRAVRAGDLVARLGGDEFGVLVRGGGGDVDAAAAELAQRILNAFELPVVIAERLLSANLSVGVATARRGCGDEVALLGSADMALHAAKEQGKGRYAVFTPEMHDAVVRRHEIKEELAQAIAREELLVQYQPIVDLVTEELVAVEALVRWEHPDRGRIPPLEFIPLAEETGLIVALGRVVLRRACEQAAAWTRAGNPPIDMQVNLSGRELEDAGLVAHVAEVLRATGLPPRRLVLEITETVLVRDAMRGGATLEQLRALGVQLALDDFGTGYSSLSYLRSLPLDVLKIAREFVDEIDTSEDDEIFVRLIAQLAATRGLRIVVEGIETVSQLEVLRRLGCHLGQGYLFARPLDAGDPALAARPAAPQFGRA